MSYEADSHSMDSAATGGGHFYLYLGILIPTLGVLSIIFYPRSQSFRYLLKITFFYFCIFVAGILAMFGCIPFYFFNCGAMVPMTCFRLLCSFWLDVKVEVRGAEKIKVASNNDQRPVVIISNHQSALDLYFMSLFWPAKCAVMIKDSLKYIPFFNVAAFLSNSIFINRTDKESAYKAIEKAVEVMHDKGLKIFVFPEGTRHHDHGLLPFKKGAFNIAIQAQIPIVPVVISDLSPFYSKGDQRFESDGNVIVEVLDPVPTSGRELESAPELCEEVRNKMLTVYKRISKEAKGFIVDDSQVF